MDQFFNRSRWRFFLALENAKAASREFVRPIQGPVETGAQIVAAMRVVVTSDVNALNVVQNSPVTAVAIVAAITVGIVTVAAIVIAATVVTAVIVVMVAVVIAREKFGV